jgi:hypothetical protein
MEQLLTATTDSSAGGLQPARRGSAAAPGIVHGQWQFEDQAWAPNGDRVAFVRQNWVLRNQNNCVVDKNELYDSARNTSSLIYRPSFDSEETIAIPLEMPRINGRRTHPEAGL